MNGGYYMLDLTGAKLGVAPAYIPGIRDKCVEAVAANKPIVIYNLTVGGATIGPTPATAYYTSATQIYLWIPGYKNLIVSNADKFISIPI